MLKYFLLSLVVLAVTAKPHRKPSSWHGHSQNNQGHGNNYHGHGNSYHGHGNNYHGHGNNHNGSNTQSGSVHQLINENGCGTSLRSSPNPFIVGGKEATPHSWPWMVSLNYYGNHMCGGSLITNQHVITAAHCRPRFLNRLTVILGKHDLTKNENGQMSIGVNSFTSHELYNSNTLENDIAIVKLSSPVTLSNTISTVCIPTQKVNDGQDCMTTGWGATQEGGSVSNTLLEVDVPIISQNECSSYYGDLPYDTMVCAGYKNGGKDSCQGDSGGPLVYEENNKWYLAGATSWGNGCARPGFPGVYARVDTQLSWIISKL